MHIVDKVVYKPALEAASGGSVIKNRSKSFVLPASKFILLCLKQETSFIHSSGCLPCNW